MSKAEGRTKGPIPCGNDDEEGEEHAVHSTSHTVLHQV